MHKKLIAVVMVALLLTAALVATGCPLPAADVGGHSAENVILLIGDGMSFSTVLPPGFIRSGRTGTWLWIPWITPAGYPPTP